MLFRSQAGLFNLIEQAATRVSMRLSSELDRLPGILADLDQWRLNAHQVLANAEHLPLTRTGALSEREAEIIGGLASIYDANIQAARAFHPSLCQTGACAGLHRPVALLCAYQATSGDGDLIEQAATRVSARLSSELDRLQGILADLDQWRLSARQVLANAEHLPLTRTGALSEREAEVIGELASIYDANIQAARAFHPSLCQTGACARLHQPVALLCTYQAKAANSGDGDLIEQAADRVAVQVEAEREQLTAVLDDLDAWRAASLQAQHDAEHMLLTRSGVLTDSERAAMRMIDASLTLNYAQASALLDATDCIAGTCHEHHRSGAVLARFHAESSRSGAGVQIVGAAQRVSAQSLQERDRVAELHKKVTTWPDRVAAIYRSRTDAARFLESRADQLAADSVAARISGVPMRLLPLQDQDWLLVARLALLQHKPLLEADKYFLTETAATAKLVLSAVSTGFTRLWQCRGDGKCEHAHSLLPVVYGQADAIEDELDRLGVDLADMPFDLDLLVEPSLGFTNWLPGDLGNPEWLEAAVTVQARGNLTAILNAASIAREAAARAHAAADNVRAEDVVNALKAMDLDALRKASPRDKFRVAPLEACGVRNIWDVLQFQEKYILAEVPGLGESSATAITQAALRLREAVRSDTPVRIDVKRKSERTATLLEALRRWDATRKFKPTEEERALAQALTTLFGNNDKVDRVLAVTEGPVAAPPRLLNDLVISALDRVVPPPVGDVDIWQDFLSRPADYFGMLTELGFTTEDEKKMHGDLPEEIIEAVRTKELKPDFLTASLRTYQNFGARFALTQEKVVIGDEMGLGKTVEALAVLAHLRANGQSHFLVVCPAAVVSNWTRETAKHTKLIAMRLHGPLGERKYAANSWIRNGGVAVTTYDLLPWAKEHIQKVEVGCAVFDEAHYIKNPGAKRSRAAAEIMDSLKYVVLMTGTPMENSVQEFRNLIGYIRSDLAESAPEFPASKFRKHVAPAYLRRNQDDVLKELPDLIEIDEWTSMSAADERAYRDAVQNGHFMDMRRAAMLSEHSVKLERLKEIVDEAEANGRRAIVFSYFREVLSEVARILRSQVFGPLTGALPATERQSLIDRFAKAGSGAVLVAQITAGGVGLNIQSASVVVICEPQIKPTMESQAIARAHRMGQTNTVQVYRLLTENSVDEHIREILAGKRQLFDEFARDSVIAKQAPDAVDVSEAELARIVVAAERERLFGQSN